MKKWKIVLPTLLATSGLPLVGMAGCQQVNVEDYKVSEEDFLYIINMVGVQYLQMKTEQTVVKPSNVNDVTTQQEIEAACSPTVYHLTTVSPTTEDPYTEEYVWKTDDSEYYVITRDNPEHDFSNPEKTDEESFLIPSSFGTIIYLYYSTFDSLLGGKLSFDSKNLCYKGEVKNPETSEFMKLEFHFFKNKLVKFWMNAFGEFSNEKSNITSEQTFTYKEETPDVPV